MPVPPPGNNLKAFLLCFLKRLWLYGWLFPLTVFGQEACLLVPIPLQQRAQQAVLIVEAKVTNQQTYWDVAHQNIYTQSTLQVFKILKGTLPKTVHVLTEGGRVGNTYHTFSGTLQVAADQQGIFFLIPASSKTQPPGQKEPAFTVYSSSQGFIRYDLTLQQAAEPFKNYSSITADVYPAVKQWTRTDFKVIRPNPDVGQLPSTPPGGNIPAANLRLQAVPAITGFSPDTLSAGTGQVLTIRGQNFGAARGSGFVQFRNADNGGASFIQALESDYIVWTDTEIKVRVSARSSTGNTPGSGEIRLTTGSKRRATSTQRLIIEFAASQVVYDNRAFTPRLVNANGLGGYTFHFTTDFNADTLAKNAFLRALRTWSCHTGINWDAGEPTPLNVTADDSINLVRFDDGEELPNGILARCISRYDGCGSKTPDQWRVSEMDVVFNQQIAWYFGEGQPAAGEVDFETVTVHEMGHGHQLNHVIKPGTIMHYAINRGQANRQLNARTDILGGQHTIAQSRVSNGCGPGRLIPLPFTACLSAPALLSFIVEPLAQEVVVAWAIPDAPPLPAFTVERSKNAAHWQAIGTITGNPNGATMQYTLSDIDPLPGASFYRLKIVQPDGTFDYSAIKRIDREVPAGHAIAPNPVPGGILWLQYVTQERGQLTIQLFDALGRWQKTFVRPYHPASDVIDLNVAGLSPGLYVLVYADGRKIHREKFIKL